MMHEDQKGENGRMRKCPVKSGRYSHNAKLKPLDVPANFSSFKMRSNTRDKVHACAESLRILHLSYRLSVLSCPRACALPLYHNTL